MSLSRCEIAKPIPVSSFYPCHHLPMDRTLADVNKIGEFESLVRSAPRRCIETFLQQAENLGIKTVETQHFNHSWQRRRGELAG